MHARMFRLLLGTLVLLAFALPALANDSALSQEGLQLWLRSDVGLERAGDVVIRWADQSGNGNDATAAAGTAPLWLDNAYGTLGALHFDEETYMQVAHAEGLNAGGEGLSVLMVYRSERGIRLAQKKSGASGTQADAWFVTAAQGLGVAGTFRQGTPLFEAGKEVHVQGNIFDPAAGTITIFDRGQVVDTLQGVKPQTPNEDDLFLGKRDHPTGTRLPWQGELFEVIIYNRALSAAERAEVEAYLLAKYGA